MSFDNETSTIGPDLQLHAACVGGCSSLDINEIVKVQYQKIWPYTFT